jgi:hypothetical protein
MPIINVDEARTCIVLKRGMRTGFSGVENPLFFKPNTRMLRARCWKSADDLTDAVAAELRTEAARATNQPHAIMLAGARRWRPMPGWPRNRRRPARIFTLSCAHGKSAE